MIAPMILVAGLGRCGTTATCLLLRAGGAMMVDSPPTFESVPLAQRGAGWFEVNGGKVSKWLDPQLNRIPAEVQARTIWLHRDSMEQGRSMLKLIGQQPRRATARVMARTIRADEPKGLAAAHRHGPVMILNFETLVNDPALAAWRIADFIAPIVTIDPRAAQLAIAKRPSRCMPDMRIEANLLQAFGAAG